MRLRLNPLLYLICVLSDFAAFVVVFTVSRGLAEAGAEPWYLGVVGAGLSFSSGVGSLLGGWLAHRFDGRAVFLTGAVATPASVAICALADPNGHAFIAGYWLLGIGLGFLYPPLVGWLNRGEDAHVNRQGVSRTLIIYCVAWNTGVLCGQLVAGSLFSTQSKATLGVAFAAATVNLIVAVVASGLVTRERPPAPAPTSRHVAARELAAAFKRLSWLANLGSMFGNSLVVHLLPDLAVSIGVHPDNHGRLLACSRAVTIGTYLLLHLSAFWHYRLSTAIASQGLAACGLLVIAGADSTGTLFVGPALLGQLVGYNYFSGIYYSTAGSSHEERALAAGLHEATLAVGMAVGTIAGGVLATLVNRRLPYLLAAAAMIVLIVVQSTAWRVWVKPMRTRNEKTCAV